MLFDRRKLLLGGAAGLMLPGLARAQAPAAIGTFPEGVGADSVFVGLNMPLTGVFSGDGTFLRHELADDVEVVRACADAFERVWKRAVHHGDYRPA